MNREEINILDSLEYLRMMQSGETAISDKIHSSWILLAIENGMFKLAERMLDYRGVPNLDNLKQRIAYCQLIGVTGDDG